MNFSLFLTLCVFRFTRQSISWSGMGRWWGAQILPSKTAKVIARSASITARIRSSTRFRAEILRKKDLILFMTACFIGIRRRCQTTWARPCTQCLPTPLVDSPSTTLGWCGGTGRLARSTARFARSVISRCRSLRSSLPPSYPPRPRLGIPMSRSTIWNRRRKWWRVSDGLIGVETLIAPTSTFFNDKIS